MKNKPFDKANFPLLRETTAGGHHMQKNFVGQKRSFAGAR